MEHDLLAAFAVDGKDELLFHQRQLEPVRTAGLIAERTKAVFLDQIEDRDGALMFDIRRGTADRFVEFDVNQSAVRRQRHDQTFNRIATERPWASKPSAFAKAMAAGARTRS